MSSSSSILALVAPGRVRLPSPRPLLARLLVAAACGFARRVAEQVGRVVLDLQHRTAVDGLAAGEEVAAALEAEAEEVGLGDEARLERPWRRRGGAVPARPGSDQPVGDALTSLASLTSPSAVPAAFFGLRLFFSAARPATSPRQPAWPRTRAGLRHAHAVDLHRAADEDAVAHVPGVGAVGAVEPQVGRADEREALALVEHVVVEHAPGFLAALERPGHQRVEVGVLRAGAGADERDESASDERGPARSAAASG